MRFFGFKPRKALVLSLSLRLRLEAPTFGASLRETGFKGIY
jgi:hypothetical protein